MSKTSILNRIKNSLKYFWVNLPLRLQKRDAQLEYKSQKQETLLKFFFVFLIIASVIEFIHFPSYLEHNYIPGNVIVGVYLIFLIPLILLRKKISRYLEILMLILVSIEITVELKFDSNYSFDGNASKAFIYGFEYCYMSCFFSQYFSKMWTKILFKAIIVTVRQLFIGSSPSNYGILYFADILHLLLDYLHEKHSFWVK